MAFPLLCIPAHMESSNRQSDLDKDELLKQQRSKVRQFPIIAVAVQSLSSVHSFFFFITSAFLSMFSSPMME